MSFKNLPEDILCKIMTYDINMHTLSCVDTYLRDFINRIPKKEKMAIIQRQKRPDEDEIYYTKNDVTLTYSSHSMINLFIKCRNYAQFNKNYDIRRVGISEGFIMASIFLHKKENDYKQCIQEMNKYHNPEIYRAQYLLLKYNYIDAFERMMSFSKFEYFDSRIMWYLTSKHTAQYLINNWNKYKILSSSYEYPFKLQPLDLFAFICQNKMHYCFEFPDRLYATKSTAHIHIFYEYYPCAMINQRQLKLEYVPLVSSCFQMFVKNKEYEWIQKMREKGYVLNEEDRAFISEHFNVDNMIKDYDSTGFTMWCSIGLPIDAEQKKELLKPFNKRMLAITQRFPEYKHLTLAPTKKKR